MNTQASTSGGLGRAIFGALTPDQQSRLLSAGHVRGYADQQLIASRGATERYLSIVLMGAVRLSNVGREGQQSVSGTLQVGDSFGEFTVFANAPRQFDFHAVGETKIREIPHTELLDILMQSPQVMGQLIEVLSRKLLFATQALEAMRQLPLIPRTARLLMALTAEQESPAVWEGTQTELAEMLGVTRVAVGYALKELKALGLLQTAYRRIVIPDAVRLQNWLLPYE